MRRAGPVAAALALSLALALASLHRGQHGDVQTFARWYGEVRGTPSRTYLTARADVNYPVLGVALAVAPGVLLAGRSGTLPGPREYEAANKLLLVPWLTLLLLAFGACASALGLGPARTVAFAVVPSTWVVGIWFGQIDAATSALQLVSAACAIRFVDAAWRREPLPRRAWWLLAGALAALDASLLSKQLALFAAPALLALPTLGLARRAVVGRRREALVGCLGVAAAFALLALPDAFLTLPRGWHSHLLRVFFIGPGHRELLANAPGLFALMGLRPGQTALDPIAFGAAPRTVGLVSFLGYALALTGVCAVGAWSQVRRDQPRPVATLALLHAGLCHLGAATLVAGSHERYPFHAFALLFLALATLRDRATRALEALAWLAATAFGTLLFVNLEWTACEPVRGIVTGPRVAALLLAVLVLGLARGWAIVRAR